MNWVDGAVLAAILVSGLIGWVRGLVREVLGVGAWVLAAYVAFTWYDRAEPLARRYIGNPDIANPVAFGVIFVVALVVLSVVASVISRAVQGSALSAVDGTLGLAFGLVRGAVLVAVAYIAGALLLPIDRWPPPVQDARSLPYIHDAAAWIASMVPPHYRPAVPSPQGGVTRATDLLQANPVGTALAARPPAPRSAE
jgi:membrane protein required for colicin V production